MTEAVRKRADGEASRDRILEAAARIAGERGYQGTSINAVSERSGLPASSIYWHFANKDELIAAVIDRSYGQWLDALDRPILAPDNADNSTLFHAVMTRVGAALDGFGDFLRLGLMLILDRNPDEPTARAKFMDVREATRERIRIFYSVVFDGVTAEQIEQLASLTLVLADGTFIAREADHLDMNTAYDLMATAIFGTLAAMQRKGSG